MSGGVKIGFCRDIITPSQNIYMDGYGSRVSPSIGVHDDLYLHVITFCEENCVSIAVYDLLYLDEDFVSEVRRRALGLGVSDVILTAIHTHSGPIISSDPRYILAPIDLGPNDIGIVDNYRNYLIEKSIKCIESSLNNLSRARIGFAIGNIGVCFNRRGEEVIDNKVHIVRIDRDLGDSISIINYSCHPVVLGPNNRYISADYPGTLRNVFEKNMQLFYNINTATIFLNGACGDINPITCRGYECSGTFHDLYIVGGSIAFEALKLYNFIRTREIGDLRFKKIFVRLPIRTPPPLDEAEKRFREMRNRYDNDYGNLELFYARELYLLASLGLKEYIDAEIDLLRIDDNLFVFIAGEPFTSIGLSIKKLSPYPNTIVVGYSNSYIGYIPTPKDFEKGGYETVHSRWSIVSPDASNILMDVISKNIYGL